MQRDGRKGWNFAQPVGFCCDTSRQTWASSRFYCPTCPYFCSIESRVKIKRKHQLVKKEIEPVFTLEDMMKGGSETEATCPHCNFGRARYQQLQIRSADEPATTFYFCLNEKCSKMWRED